MGKRDGGYPLHGDMEVDEGFFSMETPEEQKDCPLKRGRGSQRKTFRPCYGGKQPAQDASGQEVQYAKECRAYKHAGHRRFQGFHHQGED